MEGNMLLIFINLEVEDMAMDKQPLIVFEITHQGFIMTVLEKLLMEEKSINSWIFRTDSPINH
jgi:hypothetical protein